MAYITCKDLSLGYDGKCIVSNLNFKIKKGEYLCIVGENGVGKSTLMKTLLHLQEPLKGEIITGDGLRQYEIGYLPQQSAFQRDFPATVWEVVLSGTLAKCGRRPFFGKCEKGLAEEKMQQLGIWNLRKKCYRHLSGGQMQKVLLARALCAASKVLLLDEPVTGLDPKATEEFYALIQNLNQEGVAIIMISHDVSSLQFATHVLHLNREDSFFGTREDYQEAGEGSFLYKKGGAGNE
ncbi:metal ABC transporter ATP-binding protein [[Clostridium] polysaccharolyticum]|uniref:Zinc transport system ATP-binding protein n=1 Tax=[Clostridium] polysaccharolyticum TaxID=29364 RepID=A0A1I0DFU7_9FIRM|nr:metal ABC transporter ATP-binding protein [[Clostridium] polysaccharolyticum]SET31165.1 zinc transport system ATP-binding protein [[Clostridium] polysaccharolyticum]